MSDQTNATVIRYTNAPSVYDYEWTVLETTDIPITWKLGRTVEAVFRRVVLDAREDEYYSNYQCMRYQSGAYLVLTPDQWERERSNGCIIPQEPTDATQP
jgi:hypothetical protein